VILYKKDKTDDLLLCVQSKLMYENKIDAFTTFSFTNPYLSKTFIGNLLKKHW